MSKVIRVENLGKCYNIGHKGKNCGTFRDAITDAVKSIGKKKSSMEEFWALKDVSFDIEQGDRVGILGRNGAGKSTLLKVLSRITEPTTGRFATKGKVVSLLEVGTGFHQELTGRENIYLNGAILGMSKNDINRKFDEIVEFSEVEKFLDTPVKRYSSGMYVRLAFAVAAHLMSDILIVDEVLAVGDAEFQKKCIGKMNEVSKNGRTVIFVSHNVPTIVSLCNKGIFMKNGNLKLQGTIDEVVNEYINMNASQNISKDGFRDLTIRKNTYDVGKIIVKKIRIENSLGNVTNSFKMDECINIEFLCSGLSSENLGFGLIIKNQFNQWITTLTSKMLNIKTQTPRTYDELVCIEIPKVQLAPDKYIIDISITNQMGSRVDYVENACDLIIGETDVYNSGFNFTPYYGTFYLQDPNIKIINVFR